MAPLKRNTETIKAAGPAAAKALARARAKQGPMSNPTAGRSRPLDRTRQHQLQGQVVRSGSPYVANIRRGAGLATGPDEGLS